MDILAGKPLFLSKTVPLHFQTPCQKRVLLKNNSQIKTYNYLTINKLENIIGKLRKQVKLAKTAHMIPILPV